MVDEVEKFREILKDEKYAMGCIYVELSNISASLRLIAAEMTATRNINGAALNKYVSGIIEKKTK